MIKSITIVVLLLVSAVAVSAQNTTRDNSFDIPKSFASDSNYVYTFAEISPAFPGGDAALKSFIEKNIVYPPISPRATGRLY